MLSSSSAIVFTAAFFSHKMEPVFPDSVVVGVGAGATFDAGWNDMALTDKLAGC